MATNPVNYKRIASLKTVGDFRTYLSEVDVELPVDDEILTSPESPLAQPIEVGPFRLGNRFCVHPMEG